MFNLYAEVIEETETKINALYKRYEDQTGLNASQARKYLKGDEFSRWRMSMAEYLKKIDGEGANSKTAIELNTLAMKSRITREEKILSELYREMYDLANMEQSKLYECLEDVLQVSYENNSKALASNYGVQVSSYKLNEKLIRDILEFPWGNTHFSKSVWDNTDDLCANVRLIISKGFTSGASVQKMTRELLQVTEGRRYEAQRLIATECRKFAVRGETMAYKDNGIDRFIYKNGNSPNICDRCRMFNNVAIPIDKAEIYVNIPPLHPHCKCFICPYFEDNIFGNEGVTLLEDVEFDNLEPEERRALNTYISSEAYKINEKLRNGSKLGARDNKLITNLDSALDKMPNYEGEVYRSLSSVGLDVDEYLKTYEVGKIKTYPSYFSTGTEVYDGSFLVQYVIKSKTGKDLRKHNPEESEILFKRDTKFKVTKVEKHKIHMEEEND